MNNVIVDDQHVFRCNKTMVTNLIKFQTLDALSDRLNVDVIYTDFSRAFDKTNHRDLCSKLEQIGVCALFYPELYFLSSSNSSLQRVLVYFYTF